MAGLPRSSTVTMLYTDVVDSTPLVQRSGDEAAKRLFQEHHRLLKEAIAAHGGREVKWRGDGVMAAFLSAADATRCAIAMQQTARRPTGVQALGLRVGLHVGETLAWDESDYFGLPVVIAQRLCDQAQEGQIVCSGLVAGLLGSRQAFHFRSLGTLDLKGVAEPTPAMEVRYEERQPLHEWTEEESERYRSLAAVALPARQEQIASILCLLPFEPKASARIVEIGCGEGALAFAVLSSYPNAHVLALDGSPSMRERATRTLARFGPRASVESFDLGANDWLPRLDGCDAVISSLVLHHLPDGEKLRLYEDIASRLREGGAFLVADIIDVQRPEQRQLYADAYDQTARAQAVEQTGSDDLFRTFLDERFNCFRHSSCPDDEYPSPLPDQLTWIRSAGFAVADCFWLRAGFAVFGGYKSRSAEATDRLSLPEALDAARAALAEVRSRG